MEVHKEIMKLSERIKHILDTMDAAYPEAECSLDYEKPYELLISTRLSAQCTDARVNMITPALFARYPTLQAFADAEITELEELVRTCGFYHTKAQNIRDMARMLIEKHGGRVPDTMEELLELPGVGRKTANLILGDVYGQTSVVADTHCIRITNLLGLCDSKDPFKVEMRLREILPPERSGRFCHQLVLHGRAVCVARRPACGRCPVQPWCDFGRAS